MTSLLTLPIPETLPWFPSTEFSGTFSLSEVYPFPPVFGKIRPRRGTHELLTSVVSLSMSLDTGVACDLHRRLYDHPVRYVRLPSSLLSRKVLSTPIEK